MGNNTSSSNSQYNVLTYTNGDKYEGEVVRGIREGYGTYYYHNGDKYEGMWYNNKKHGMGTLFYKNGNLYVGEWHDSEKSGLGTFYFKNGDKYHGEFNKGRREGKGYYQANDGSKFTGDFVWNKKSGEGEIIFKSGKSFTELWDNGVLISTKRNIENTLYLKQQEILEEEELNKDSSFQEYIEEQLKSYSETALDKQIRPKYFTFEIARYFKARIPNNYFDTMHIIACNVEILFQRPFVHQWKNSDVLIWMNGLGLSNYADKFMTEELNGATFLSLTLVDLVNIYQVTKNKDLKVLLKSIDFLKLFFKLTSFYLEYVNSQKKKRIIEINDITFKKKTKAIKFLPKENINGENGTNIINNNSTNINSNNGMSLKRKSIMKDRSSIANISNNNNSNILALTSMNNNNSTTNNLFFENEDFFLTKIALISINLSGFNFFIDYNEIKIQDKIGEGGFGEVFLGIWNGKQIAIKKFHMKDNHKLKHCLHKFIKEINIISNLRHPNIICYMGATIHKNEYFMISEYVSKGSLFDHLHVHKTKLTEQEQLSIAYDLAVALKYLHSRNINHCDLKSSNILLDEGFKIKISDFGLSQMKNVFYNENKGKIGTPHWMAPEIMKGQAYTKAADVFSFGMILWEIVSNEIPYYGLVATQIVALVADCRKIVDMPKSINNDLRRIIKNCLLYEPNRRPDMMTVIKYLEHAQKKLNNLDYLAEELSYFVN